MKVKTLTEDEAFETTDAGKVEDYGWESNKNDENPKQIPWPKENESKE
jgi:hypothetical protein